MKVCLLGDLHFGVKKTDKIFQQSQFEFLTEQLVPELKERGVDTIICLGDVFDSRQSINVNTQNVVLDLFGRIFKDFKVHIVLGNHDIYYTTTTEVNSLKMLNLLPNVKIYEENTFVDFEKKQVLMLPWIVDYEAFDNLNIRSEYVMAHLDICGMKMDKYQYSVNGSTIERLFKRFDHIYTGHYHTRSEKTDGDGRNITYVGSPYQLTRIDSGDPRGYTILDLETNETEFVENEKSIKFNSIRFPKVIEDKEKFVKGNVIDVEVEYADSKYAKKIYEYTKDLEQYLPAYPVNIELLQRVDIQNENKKIEGVDLFSLFSSYIEDDEEIHKNKKQIVYSELMQLYTIFKGR